MTKRQQRPKVQSDPFDLRISLTNDAAEPAYYAVIFVYLDPRLIVVKAAGMSVEGDVTLTLGDKAFSLTPLRINWAIPGKLPIFEDSRFSLTDGPLKLAVPSGDKGRARAYAVAWQIKSPRMAARARTLRLELSANDSVSLVE